MTEVRYLPYRTRAVVGPSAPRRPPQTWASGGPSAEFRTTQWRGGLTNQHPRLYPSARHRSTQAPNHHHMSTQLGVGQAFAYQGTRGGSSGAQIPFNPHHGTHPVPHSGGPRSLHPGYNTPVANIPDIQRQFLADLYAAQNSHQGYQGITGWHPQMTQSLSACALQSSSQAAIAPQQSPPKQDLSKMSTATAQQSQPASVLSFEDAFSTDSSSVREETGSKEIELATWTCSFPECKKKCGRFQELERHICERHLPPHLYCEQPGCDLTWSRPYLLKSHRADKHPGVPMPEQDGFMIYDAKVLAKQVRTKEIGIEQAVQEACSLFDEKAKQMGMLGIWCWMNGL